MKYNRLIDYKENIKYLCSNSILSLHGWCRITKQIDCTRTEGHSPYALILARKTVVIRTVS